MTIEEMREKRKSLIDEATGVVADGSTDLTTDEQGSIDSLLNKADELKGSIEGAEASQNRSARLSAAVDDLSRSAGRRTQAGTADAVPVGTIGPGATSADDGTARIGSVRERVLDDPNLGWRHLGEFAKAVATAQQRPDMVDERLQIGAAATGLSQTVGSEGGWLVPPTFSTAIWDGLNAEADSLLAMTDNYTVEGESVTFIANAETSRATGSRFGGVQGYWIAEADQITSSAPKIRQVKIEPQELAVLVYVTDKLLNNSPTALNQFVTRAAISEIDFLTGDAIINGTGAGQPSGILGSESLVTVSATTGQPANTIEYENVLDMWTRLHARSRAGAVWLINQDIEPQLNAMTIGVGVAGVPVYLPPGGASALPYATIFGRPVKPIEYCPTLGTLGDIILADLKGYITGTKGGVDSAMSIHLRFDYAETAFRFMFAVDGQTWLNSAITPYKGTATQSMFVVLATRS